MKDLLKALHAFVKINALEALGVNYNTRLAECAKICECEEIFNQVGNLFDNQKICTIMISWIETTF